MLSGTQGDHVSDPGGPCERCSVGETDLCEVGDLVHGDLLLLLDGVLQGPLHAVHQGLERLRHLHNTRRGVTVSLSHTHMKCLCLEYV